MKYDKSLHRFSHLGVTAGPDIARPSAMLAHVDVLWVEQIRKLALSVAGD